MRDEHDAGHVFNLENDLQLAAQHGKALLNENENLRRELEQLRAQQSALHDQVAEDATKLKQSQSKADKYQGVIREQESQYAEQTADSEKAALVLAREVEVGKRETEGLRAELARTQEEREMVLVQVTSLERRQLEQQTENRARLERCRNAESELESSSEQSAALETENDALRARLREAQVQLGEARSRGADAECLSHELASEQARSADLAVRNERLTVNLAEVQAEAIKCARARVVVAQSPKRPPPSSPAATPAGLVAGAVVEAGAGGGLRRSISLPLSLQDEMEAALTRDAELAVEREERERRDTQQALHAAGEVERQRLEREVQSLKAELRHARAAASASASASAAEVEAVALRDASACSAASAEAESLAEALSSCRQANASLERQCESLKGKLKFELKAAERAGLASLAALAAERAQAAKAADHAAQRAASLEKRRQQEAQEVGRAEAELRGHVEDIEMARAQAHRSQADRAAAERDRAAVCAQVQAQGVRMGEMQAHVALLQAQLLAALQKPRPVAVHLGGGGGGGGGRGGFCSARSSSGGGGSPALGTSRGVGSLNGSPSGYPNGSPHGYPNGSPNGCPNGSTNGSPCTPLHEYHDCRASAVTPSPPRLPPPFSGGAASGFSGGCSGGCAGGFASPLQQESLSNATPGGNR
jgi:chromosome segregation ATPase